MGVSHIFKKTTVFSVLIVVIMTITSSCKSSAAVCPKTSGNPYDPKNSPDYTKDGRVDKKQPKKLNRR